MKNKIRIRKYSINLNTLFKNIIELLIFLICVAIIITDTYRLVIEPIFTNYLTTYTIFGILTLILAIFGTSITYNDLKKYFGGK